MKKKTIFFIDDEAYRMEAHALYLEHHEFDIIYVSNFNDALEQFKLNENTIDLVILDIMFPIENIKLDADEEKIVDNGSSAGLVLYDRMMKGKRKIKTVVLSVRDDLQEEITERKIERYLTKPIKPSQLLEEIKEVLGL